MPTAHRTGTQSVKMLINRWVSHFVSTGVRFEGASFEGGKDTQWVEVVAPLETNSWRWPAFAFSYMFVLAWVSALVARTIAVGLGA
jgi:hypothetical protein